MTAVSRKSLVAICFVLIATPVAWAAQPVVFTILTRGNDSGISTFSQAVVRSPDRWAALWLRHAAGSRIPPGPPVGDFSRKMGISGFFGKGPPGRRPAISAIFVRDGPTVGLV